MHIQRITRCLQATFIFQSHKTVGATHKMTEIFYQLVLLEAEPPSRSEVRLRSIALRTGWSAEGKQKVPGSKLGLMSGRSSSRAAADSCPGPWALRGSLHRLLGRETRTSVFLLLEPRDTAAPFHTTRVASRFMRSMGERCD